MMFRRLSRSRFPRLLRSRWVLAVAVLLIAGIGVAVYAVNGGGGSTSAALAKKGGDPGPRIEQLHQRTANRTAGDDPDDRPTLISPEQAAQIAVQAVQGNSGQGGVTPQGKPGGPNSGSVRKMDNKDVKGKAVFAITVGSTEVDVDRQSGQVVSMQPVAGQ